MKKGDLEEAMYLTKNVTQFAPEIFLGWYTLGLIYRRKGKIKEAFSAYSKALKLNPRHPETHQNLGLVSLLLGNIKDARNSISQAITLLSTQGRHLEADTLTKKLGGLIKMDDC